MRGCRSRSTARSWTSPTNAGEGQFNALQLELKRRFRSGFAINAAYTLAGSDSNAPDSGNSTIGVIQYDPYDIEKDRGPDPERRQAPLRAQQHLGHPGRTRTELRLDDAGVGRCDRRRLDACRRSSRRAPGRNLTPFFVYGHRPDLPGEYRPSASTASDSSAKSWRPDVIGDPNIGGVARAVLRPDGVPAAGRRIARQREEGQPQGAWHVDRQLRVLQGHRADQRRARWNSRRCSTTRSTTRSSSCPDSAPAASSI